MEASYSGNSFISCDKMEFNLKVNEEGYRNEKCEHDEDCKNIPSEMEPDKKKRTLSADDDSMLNCSTDHQETSYSGSSFTCDNFQCNSKVKEEDHRNEKCDLDEENPTELTWNVENMPFMTMDEKGIVQPIETPSSTPLASTVTSHQPSTSGVHTGRLIAIYFAKEQSYEGVIKRHHQNEKVKKRSCTGTPAMSETSKQIIKLHLKDGDVLPEMKELISLSSNKGRAKCIEKYATNKKWKCRQSKPVVELYPTDKEIPAELKQMIHELEVSQNSRTEQLMNTRRKISLDKNGEGNKEMSIADVLFGGDNTLLHFQWSPMSSFEGKQEVFQPDDLPGPRKPISSSYKAFRQFWDDNILEHIVTETNRYASQVLPPSCRWVNTNKHEILILFAFWMMLGIVKMPSINSCFSSRFVLKSTIFRKLLTQNRYHHLDRALHFVDNATRTRNSSKLFCLGPVVDHLNEKFKEAYTLSQDISIDESLLLWKGTLSFKQRIRTKSAREGIKTYELCESATGYLWSFQFYLGKDRKTSSNTLPKTVEIVMQLIKPLLNKGHRLFMDNWYNSPLLARYLKRNNTDCVGTLRKTRKGVPNLIKVATIPEGMYVARHSGDVVVMAYQDLRTVFTISTYDGTESVPIYDSYGKPTRFKPKLIVEYNKSMGGVDRKDQRLEPYLIERKRCLKWYKKVFKRLLNVSILNSLILVGRSMNTNEQQLMFRLNLVEKIMKNHLALVPASSRRVSFKDNNILSNARFKGLHFVTHMEADKVESNTKERTRRLCVWCLLQKRKYVKTVWKCETCNFPLCLEECFKAFHTSPCYIDRFTRVQI